MTQTPGQLRTAAAIAKRRRNHEDSLAAKLRERGWLAVPPEVIAAVQTEADRIADSAEDVNEHRHGGLEERDRIREHAYGMRTALELLTRRDDTP